MVEEEGWGKVLREALWCEEEVVSCGGGGGGEARGGVRCVVVRRWEVV